MLNAATRQFIREHRSDDVQQLALRFKPDANSGIDLQAALTQIAGRQGIKHKIPSWYKQDDLLYPTRLALEQCSSEATARYKASLLSGHSFADLTGGFGVDTAFIAPQFIQTQYVERQTELALVARHNFAVSGLTIQTHTVDGVDFLKTMQPVNCLYLDPARRSSTGRKMLWIEDCEPDILSIQDELLSKADNVLIKLSPLLDIHAALKVLKKVYQIHIVSVDNECKELLFLLRNAFSGEPAVVCVNIVKQNIQSDTFTLSEEKNNVISFTSIVRKYLYEPNASLLKGGFYKSLSLRYAVDKLHPDSHLYTSNVFIPNFPGRIFQIECASSFNKQDLKAALRTVSRANLTVRNFPLSVEQLRKQLKIKDGGDNYLFATTLADGRRVLLKACKKEKSL
ncbi:MAG: SAM-dependent methyltransferase [Dysgonamonadaceae bacterium]|jgi:hypothetical protein|nr:SAM-dependent methyltransferase [Dysgonamonadaceae bacterium]